MLVSQASAHFALAHCKAESSPAPPGLRGSSTEEVSSEIVQHIRQGVLAGASTGRSFLCFNGGAHFWNIFLPVLRKESFEQLLIQPAIDTLKFLCETLTGLLDKQVLVNPVGTAAPFNRSVDFNYAVKLEIACELSVTACRVYLATGTHEEVVKLCDSLLNKPIGQKYRKELESARGASIAVKAPSSQKTAAKQPDSQTAEPLALMQFASYHAKDTAKKTQCGDALEKATSLLAAWAPNERNEEELALCVELWTRLGRQVLAQGKNTLAGDCAAKAVRHQETGELSEKRLFWYSLAEFFYAQVLSPESSSEALQRLSKAAAYGARVHLNKLVLDAGREMFNIALTIPGSHLLVVPMSQLAEVLVALKENSDPDFLLLFYKKLVESLVSAGDWATGEKLIEKAFSIVPLSHQRILWESQMLFLSKQGKNVHNYLLRIKETDPYMRAMIWVKLARSSLVPEEADASYQKAVEILRAHAESSGVLLEWATWLHARGQNSALKLTAAADVLLDIERDVPEERSSRVSSKFSSNLSSISKFGGGLQEPNSKSRLTSRDSVEGVPEKMNVTHFDRIVRVYVMLGELAPNLTRRKNFLLKAVEFVKRALETCGFSGDWTWSLPGEKAREMAHEENRETVCAFAFDKPLVTHVHLRRLARELDKVFLSHSQCALVLEYLKVFSLAVLKDENYYQLYCSWKCRVLGEATAFTAKRTVSERTLATHLLEELLQLGDCQLTGEFLKELDAPPEHLLAEFYTQQGQLKESIEMYSIALKQGNLQCVPRAAFQLVKAKLFNESLGMLQSSISAVASVASLTPATQSQQHISFLLSLAYVSLYKSSHPVATPEEKAQLKVTSVSSLEEFVGLSKLYGCSAENLYIFLKLQTLAISQFESKLLHRLNKANIGNRYSRVNALKSLSLFCSTLCVDLLDTHQGEGKSLNALFNYQLGQLFVLEETLNQEKSARQVYADVVEQYLDETHRTLELETSIQDTALARAIRLLTEACEGLPDDSRFYPAVKTALEQAKQLDQTAATLMSPGTVAAAGMRSAKLIGLHFKLQLNETRIEEQREGTFFELAFYQHGAAREHLLSNFLENSKKLSKEAELFRLLRETGNSLDTLTSPINELLNESSVYKLLTHLPPAEQLRERLLPGTAIFILQYSQDLSELWAGFLLLDKEKQSKVWLKSSRQGPEDGESLKAATAQFRDLRALVYRAPVHDENAHSKLIEKTELRLKSVIALLAAQFEWLREVDLIINPELPEEPVGEAKGKKAPPPGKGKSTHPLAELNLTLPTSGISTLYLCIDHRFLELPWEGLPVFSQVPLVSRDFSLVTLDYRVLKNPVFTKDSVKCALDSPLDPLVLEKYNSLSSELTAGKQEVLRDPAPSSFEHLFTRSSFLMTLLDEGISVQDTLLLTESTPARAVALFDRYSSLKHYMKRYHPRVREYPQCFTLLGTAAIVTNAWATTPEVLVEVAGKLTKGVLAGQPLGAALFNAKEALSSVTERLSFVLYGAVQLKIA